MGAVDPLVGSSSRATEILATLDPANLAHRDRVLAAAQALMDGPIARAVATASPGAHPRTGFDLAELAGREVDDFELAWFWVNCRDLEPPGDDKLLEEVEGLAIPLDLANARRFFDRWAGIMASGTVGALLRLLRRRVPDPPRDVEVRAVSAWLLERPEVPPLLRWELTLALLALSTDAADALRDQLATVDPHSARTIEAWRKTGVRPYAWEGPAEQEGVRERLRADRRREEEGG